MIKCTYSPPAIRKSVVMLALVWCRGKVYYQMDKRAAIGEKYDVPERYTDTQNENTKTVTTSV
jgi:hypothetical protein